MIFAQVDAVIVSDRGCLGFHRCRRALELSIPVLNYSYISDSISDGSLKDYDKYIELGQTRVGQLQSGKIAGELIVLNVSYLLTITSLLPPHHHLSPTFCCGNHDYLVCLWW